MNKVRRAVAGLLVGFAWFCSASQANGQERITVHSALKHRGEDRTFCINFRADAGLKLPCYFRYGSLYVGDDHDWFESSPTPWNRSVIKDLGPKDWADQFTIPTLQPLPELQPGEQRTVTIDASGADGVDGVRGMRGRDGANVDESMRSTAWHETKTSLSSPAKPKHDGKPRVDPVFLKAVVGHMYVMHVVHETADFYVLFRVEKIERGSNCTISWMQVPAPSAENVRN